MVEKLCKVSPTAASPMALSAGFVSGGTATELAAGASATELAEKLCNASPTAANLMALSAGLISGAAATELAVGASATEVAAGASATKLVARASASKLAAGEGASAATSTIVAGTWIRLRRPCRRNPRWRLRNRVDLVLRFWNLYCNKPTRDNTTTTD